MLPMLVFRFLLPISVFLLALPVMAQEPPATQPPAAAETAPARLTAPPAGVAPPAEAPASLPDAGAKAEAANPPADAPLGVLGSAAPPVDNRYGIGIALSYSSGAGFAVRRNWDGTSLQLSAFAIITDRGDSSLYDVGAQFAQRLHSWHSNGRSLLPSTSSIRVVVGADYLYRRTFDDISNPPNINGCTRIGGCTSREYTTRSYFNTGAGIGFEFGAIQQPGIGVTFDVVLTASFRDGEFWFLLPLPQLAVLYNW